MTAGYLSYFTSVLRSEVNLYIQRFVEADCGPMVGLCQPLLEADYDSLSAS